jgi:energy-coupling factor transporter transmembrane protein EcfT
MSTLALVFRRLKRPRLTAGARLAVLLLTVSLAVLSGGVMSLLLLTAAITYSLLSGDGGLKVAWRWQLWLPLLSLLLLSPFAIGQHDMSLWGVPFSGEGLRASVYMLLRALTIAVAVGGFANTVSVDDLVRLFERAGLAGLGFAVGVAFNMLPTISTEAQTVFDTMRLRGGFRRRRIFAVRMLLITVLTNALRHADDIVCAAEARAFQPAKEQAQDAS